MAVPTTTPEYKAPEFLAYIDTDCCRFHVSIDVKLMAVSTIDHQDEVEFRARQVLDLYRAALEDETRRMEYVHSMVFHQVPPPGTTLGHAHCECRNAKCGHLDIRHEAPGGACTFPGCECKEWR